MDIKLARQFLALPRPKDEVLTQLAEKYVKKPMDKKYLYKYTIYGVWG